MALAIVARAWTREAYKVAQINRTGAGGVIGHVNDSNYTGSSGTIHSEGAWRADRQNPTATHSNIQVQANGVFGVKSSIGGVLVPLSLATQIGAVNSPGPDSIPAKARASELTRAIQGALTRSVGSWRYVPVPNAAYAEYQVYEVTGTFSC
ncbi:MAG: hypothetical protein KIT83_19060 [Bryobacterales bacterium]|nr:hypothetical protein [Bryobacterales bacterium]